MEKKINIEISLSRNFNKITLCFLDENISYETTEELKTKIREKFAFLRAEVEREFEEKPQPKAEGTPTSQQKITEPQKKFLVDGLNYKGDTDNLSKSEASELIAELKGNWDGSSKSTPQKSRVRSL